jgi:ferric iron reductase protein FhuF
MIEVDSGDPLAPYPSPLRGGGAPEGRWRGNGIPASLLADPSLPFLAGMLNLARQRWTTGLRAAALQAWKAYSAAVALPVATGWALNRQVPLITLSQTFVSLHEDKSWLRFAFDPLEVALLQDDPAAGHPQALSVENETALLVAARASVIDQHFRPLIESLCEQTDLEQRPFWGSVAVALAKPLLRLAPGLARDPVEETARLLSGMGYGLDQLVEIKSQPDSRRAPTFELRRRTCCLAFSVPGRNRCGACPHNLRR